VKVTSQPVGTLFDGLLPPDGRMPPEAKALVRKELGVLTVGSNPVDLLSSASPMGRRQGSGGCLRG